MDLYESITLRVNQWKQIDPFGSIYTLKNSQNHCAKLHRTELSIVSLVTPVKEGTQILHKMANIAAVQSQFSESNYCVHGGFYKTSTSQIEDKLTAAIVVR